MSRVTMHLAGCRDAVDFTGRSAAIGYHEIVAALEACEGEHDALEGEAFAAADADLCALIEAAPPERLDGLRELRVRLHLLHAAFRVRRSGIVAESAADLAAAIPVREAAEVRRAS